MRFGLDSTGMVPIWAHRSVGSTVALRYLSRFTSKVVSASEAQAYRKNGISLVLVFEDYADNALSGFWRGVSDAKFARAQANSRGLPLDCPIFFAVDDDMAPRQMPAIIDYFHGVNSILGVNHTGGYGGFWVIKRLFDAGVIRYGWQAYAWSGGNFDKRSGIYQYSNGHRVGGVDTDFNHIYAVDFGQCWIQSLIPPKPIPAPVPIEIPKESEMISAVSQGGSLHVFVELPHDKNDSTKGSTVYEIYQTDGTHWAGGAEGKQKALAYPLARIPENIG